MPNKIKKEELILDDTIKQNKKGEAILGKLSGPCADFIHPTRNGRFYDEQLWEKVFSNPLVEEAFECGGILGELDHPTDRTDTCSEKIAICMPEKPTKDKDGHLIATFDILDTPNGRIAYTLAKYGYKLGISSRGEGDVVEDLNGNESVDPETYDFKGFDLVLLPAVKAARLKMVESLQNGKTFKQAINEALDSATEDEKKVMTETLTNLNLLKDENPNKDNITKNIAANDTGANVVKDLQEALLANQKAKTQLLELQEKLSVCYAKEAKYEEDIAKYKNAIRNLSESASNAKALQTKIDSLVEDLKTKDDLISEEKVKYEKLLSKQEARISRQSQLNESLNNQALKLKEKDLELSKLNESFNSYKAQSEEKEKSLNESLAEIKKDLTIKTTEYNTKLTNANKLVEQYRKTAKNAVNKYIESKATMLGVTPNEVKNRLPSNYSFADIDNTCDSLSQYKINLSKLPLQLQESKIKIAESKESILPKGFGESDEIDASLLTMAKMIK